MTTQDRYIHGVPCWVDTAHSDPVAAAEFYGALFGWECEDSMPADAPGHYLTARIDGAEAAAIGSAPDGTTEPVWNTYVWVDDADATTAAAVEAGATVLAEPADVFDAGRSATFADPEGAAVSVWQAGRHRGALAVNQHGGLNFNNLHTRDVDRAAAFYGAVFGWQVLEVEGSMLAWALPDYGDFLEQINPGTLANMESMNAPTGFETVVAAIVPIDGADADATAHWGVTFGVDDAEAAAIAAVDLGGTVVSPPTDAPWVRSTTLADPQGATFVASQFVPPT